MNNDKKQILWLNSIKGIACWIVFIGHFENDYGYIPFLNRVFEKGRLFTFICNETWALNLFFIISSFLAASVFLNEEEEFAQKAGIGIIKRYFRLSIPILLMNMCVFILQKVGLGSYRVPDMFAKNYTLFDVFRNAFWDTMLKGSTEFNYVMWMVGELFVGYCIIIILCLVIRHMNRVAGYILMGVITICLILKANEYTSIVYGLLLYMIYSSDALEKCNKLIRNILGLIFMVLGALITSYSVVVGNSASAFLPDNPFGFSWVYVWIGAILFMTGIVFSTWVTKLIDNKWIAATGRICFPVFLFHRVINATVAVKVYDYFCSLRGLDTDGVKMAFGFSLILTIVVSLIYIWLIEPYINKLIGLIIKGLTVKKRVNG